MDPVLSQKPPLPPSKVLSMRSIDDSLAQINSFISSTIPHRSSTPSSSLYPPPAYSSSVVPLKPSTSSFLDDVTEFSSDPYLWDPLTTPSASSPPQIGISSVNYLETISNRENKQLQEHIFDTQDSAVRMVALKEQEISRLLSVRNLNIKNKRNINLVIYLVETKRNGTNAERKR